MMTEDALAPGGGTVVVVAGAAGAGKSTVGRALAEELDWPFVDADDLHAEASIAKMRAGVGLSDEERGPWLERVREVMLASARSGRSIVVACSALRDRYRRFLTAGLERQVRFVFLRGSRELLEERVRGRAGHFASAGIVASQLEALEPPTGEMLVLDAALPVDVLVGRIRRALSS